MKAIKVIFLFITLMLVGSNMSYAQEDTALNSALEKIIQASLTGNNQEIIRYTAPRLIKALGGEESTLKLFNETLASRKDNDTTRIDTVINYNKMDPIQLGSIYFKFIPQLIVMSIPDKEKKMIAVTNIMAIKEDENSNWKFIDTNNIGDEELDIILPEFKDKIKVPRATSEPIIIPKNEVSETVKYMLEIIEEAVKGEVEESVSFQ